MVPLVVPALTTRHLNTQTMFSTYFEIAQYLTQSFVLSLSGSSILDLGLRSLGTFDMNVNICTCC
jgi:hypothetical protein